MDIRLDAGRAISGRQRSPKHLSSAAQHRRSSARISGALAGAALLPGQVRLQNDRMHYDFLFFHGASTP
jgi:hypothetical protein